MARLFPPEKEIPHERNALMQRPPFGGDTLLYRAKNEDI
jgi:hypothetical protein